MRVLLIGYGSIGKRHADVLSHAVDSIESVHVVSRQKNLPYHTYPTIEEVADIESYDYFIIAKPTSEHYSLLLQLNKLVAGKIILVEKPIFEKEYDYSSRLNTTLVAYNLRFHPVISWLKKDLGDRKVLSVHIHTGQYLPDWRPGTDYTQSYSATLSGGGGVLLDLSHEIDYLQYLFGPIIEVKSYVEHVVSLSIETEAIAIMVGRLSSGAIFSLDVDYLSLIPIRQITIYCEGVTYIVDVIQSLIRKRVLGSDEQKIFLSDDRNLSYIAMHNAVIKNGDYTSLCTADEAIDVLRVIDKIKGDRA